MCYNSTHSMTDAEGSRKPELTFSPESSNVLAIAMAEAMRLRHNYIGTEHILLGLVSIEGNEVSKLLDSKGVTPSRVRSSIEFIIGQGEEVPTAEPIYTPRAKKIIEYANEEARKDGTDVVTPVHLLIGTIREGEGIAASVLESLGVMYHNLIPEVTKLRVPDIQRIFPVLRELIAVLSDAGIDKETKNKLSNIIKNAIQLAKNPKQA